jgi:ADP-ribose pyrophosphatase
VSVGKRTSTRVYTGNVISLDVDLVEFPNGTTGEIEMIRHPGASAVVPFLSDPHGDDPQLLLIKQYRYAAGGYMYEIPAGRLEPGEAPASCAARELREETGCTATSILPLYTMYTTPGFTDERIHIFLATGLTRGPAALESDEFLSVESIPLRRALEMIKSGEINDGKTTAGILFVAGFIVGV